MLSGTAGQQSAMARCLPCTGALWECQAGELGGWLLLVGWMSELHCCVQGAELSGQAGSAWPTALPACMAPVQCMVHKLSRPVHLATSHKMLWQDTHCSGAEDSWVAPQCAANVAHCSTMKPILQISHKLLGLPTSSCESCCVTHLIDAHCRLKSVCCSCVDWQTTSHCGATPTLCGLHDKAMQCEGCMEAFAVSVRAARSQSTTPGCFTISSTAATNKLIGYIKACCTAVTVAGLHNHGRSAQHAANAFPAQLRCMPSEGTCCSHFWHSC